MDRVLLEDVDQRLHEFPGAESIQLVKPASNASGIKPQDILDLARDTTTSRVLIVDIRSQTIGQLQPAFSDIIRFNRPDFNHYCYTVLIGDGPRNFLHPDRGKKALPAYLSDLRINFSPAVFFGDPFLYYSDQEIQEMVIEHNFRPEKISQQFEKYFKGDLPTVEHVRKYFRAAGKQGDEKIKEKTERQKLLNKLVTKMILDEFPDDRELVLKALSKEGLSIPGEILQCNIYPFFFEEWVLDLFEKAQTAK